MSVRETLQLSGFFFFWRADLSLLNLILFLTEFATNREEVAWLLAKSSRSDLNSPSLSLALSRLGSVGGSFPNVCSPFLTCGKVRALLRPIALNKYCSDPAKTSQMSVAVVSRWSSARHQLLVPMLLKASRRGIFIPLSAASAQGTTHCGPN